MIFGLRSVILVEVIFIHHLASLDSGAPIGGCIIRSAGEPESN